VDHFRVFGYVSHVHVPDSRRVKLDAKSLKCILLGVSEESKAYRLFNPTSNKIIVSHDVVFEEDQQWCWEDNHKHNLLTDLEWEPQEAADTNDGEIEAKSGADAELGAISAEKEADSGIIADLGAISGEQEPEFDEEESALNGLQPGVDDEEQNTPNSNILEHQGRIKKPPVWMQDYSAGQGFSDEEAENSMFLALLGDSDPMTYEEAAKSKRWRSAMDQEMQSMERNDTWELTALPLGGKSIGVKWIFKTKVNEKREVDKYKARLVAKSYCQQHGIDYAEVFEPVAHLDTIRIVIAFAAQNSWVIYQLDVKSAFLHGEINEEVFVDQPPGYEQKGHESKVYRLKKALYGLKQAPRAWYSRIETYFIKEGFTKCPYEHTLFIKTVGGGKILIVCLYVDDLIFTGNDQMLFAQFKNSMMSAFDMTDLGRMRFFLGIEVL